MYKFLKKIETSLKLRFYRKFKIPYLEKKIRKKNIINIVFVVWSLGAWKSESLYKKMLNHPKFNPILIIGKKTDEKENFTILKQYCLKKRYNFRIVNNLAQSFWKDYHPDIIFYQKPYGGEFLNNLRSLFCYVSYAFHNSIEDWSFKTPLIYCCWQVYYENKDLCKYYSDRLGRGVWNGYATGIPPMDDLLITKKDLKDPWKKNNQKKRIIYAPHHSINPDNWWQTSTFLETGELMLQLAEKYSDKIQWAFKPHPLLRGKLEKIWGEERTNEYYKKWEESEWSQFEDGEYLSLFKYSDAMIHDCGSFIEEYISTGKPVMYLIRNTDARYPWNKTFLEAFDLHYKTCKKNEIEQFILNIINGIDPKKETREKFFVDNLIPPKNKSACENIMNCILSSEAKNIYR